MSNLSIKIRKTIFYTVATIFTILDYAIILLGFVSLFIWTPNFWGKPIVVLLICAVSIPWLFKIIFNLLFKRVLLIFGNLLGLKDENFTNGKYVAKS